MKHPCSIQNLLHFFVMCFGSVKRYIFKICLITDWPCIRDFCIELELKAMSFQFDVHVTVHHDKFLIIKPTRCTHFSNSFLEWNSTCFRQFLCPSSGVFHCTHSNEYMSADSLRAGSASYSQAVNKPVWHIPLLCVQWKTPDNGQRNCPNHVEFHSKNKSEMSASSWFKVCRPSCHCEINGILKRKTESVQHV